MVTPVASGTVISQPTPLYQNLPIRADFFQPSRFVISDITLGLNTIVTTTTDMNYVVGQQVRLIIPEPFRCDQLNGVTGIVIFILDTDQVLLDINSSVNVDAYFPAETRTPAEIIAVGDVNTGQINTQGLQNQSTYIPGSFINISPQ